MHRITNTSPCLVVLLTAAIIGWVANGSRAAQTDSPQRAFVVNTGDGTVSLIDLQEMQQIKRYEVGPRPYGVAVSRDGKTLAVGVEDEECVKFFSLPEFEQKGKAHIGPMHNDHIILSDDGKFVLVANFHSDNVVGVDIGSMQEAFRIEGTSAPHVIKYGPLRKHAFVTCKKITGIAIIDPAEQKLVKFHQINVNPRSLTFSPNETKVYFGSFWVDGFFEMDVESGEVTRLFAFDPPEDDSDPQEVTYHGVEALTDTVVVAAHEGRSYVDAVDVTAGQLLDRLEASQPCCVELIPGQQGTAVRFLISNLGDGSIQVAELSAEGKLKTVGKIGVGKAPKRVAFLPPCAQ